MKDVQAGRAEITQKGNTVSNKDQGDSVSKAVLRVWIVTWCIWVGVA